MNDLILKDSMVPSRVYRSWCNWLPSPSLFRLREALALLFLVLAMLLAPQLQSLSRLHLYTFRLLSELPLTACFPVFRLTTRFSLLLGMTAQFPLLCLMASFLLFSLTDQFLQSRLTVHFLLIRMTAHCPMLDSSDAFSPIPPEAFVHGT
jgi:hypothetical protein